MPNDYVTLKALAVELNELLTDGRIDRVNMPTEHEVLLFCRAKGKNGTLLLRALAGMPRFYLSSQKFESPLTPPNFCMVLRKYLHGAKMIGCGMLNGDRIFYLDTLTRNELNDLNTYRLVFELITTKPNVLLLDANGIIIDAMKRNAETGVFPKRPYCPPRGNKKSVEEVDASAFSNAEEFYKTVTETCFGLSKESMEELRYQLKISPISVAWDTILNQYSHSNPVAERKDGKLKTYYAYPYQCVTTDTEKFQTLSAAAEATDLESAYQEYKQKSTHHLTRNLKKLRNRLERRIQDNKKRLEDGVDKEKFLEAGELLKCNFYHLKKGMTEIAVEDFYHGGERNIALDPLLSPVENAEKYFKLYLKKKGGEAYAMKEAPELQTLQNYLDAIEESIRLSETEREYEEIAMELNALLGNKNVKKDARPKKNRPSAPLHFQKNGCEIWVGSNNIQNQEVTFRIGASEDIWLHAKDYHGAHVIIKGKCDDETLRYAAGIAAYYSGGRTSDKVQVDYTRRKHVKNLQKTGMVTYRNQTSLLVAPAPPEKI